MAKISKKPKAKSSSKRGAVSLAAHVAHEENDVCGCDVEISDADATADADLPAAKGGVEVLAAKPRR